MNDGGCYFCRGRNVVSSGAGWRRDIQRRGRQVYAVNPVAGLTWLCMKDGFSHLNALSLFQTHSMFTSRWPPSGYAQALRCLIISDCFDRRAEIPKTREIPKTHPTALPKGSPLIGAGSGVRYQIFEKQVCVAAPSELQPVIDSLLRNLRIDITEQTRPLSSQIDISPCGDAWEVAVSGQEISCTTKSVAPELERLLIQAVVPATPHLLTFHAAAVQYGARSFLLAGQSGTGKTTLSLALTRAGWDFGSDEIVLLSRDLRLRPLPFPPCIKADTFSSVETWFPQLRSLPEHDRYGKRIKYLPIESNVFDADAGFVVFPHYDRNGDTSSSAWTVSWAAAAALAMRFRAAWVAA